MTTLRERVLRELEQERIQSEIRKNIAEAEKIEAEAKKMEAEARHFNRSWIRIIIKYGIAGIIFVPVAIHLYLDTFKILYDINSYKIEKLEDKKIEFEKHYLEKLMRIASANAFQAYAGLARRNYIYLDKTSKYHSEEKAATAYSQACYLLHDYWQIVIEIATETQEGLLPEVKEKVASWLKEGEEKNICPEECRTGNEPLLLSPIRRKSLDLIELHVAQVRAGNSQLPKNLINTLMEQLESQEFDN